MRKDAQKGYARLAQTAERQTPTTTTHTALTHTYILNYANFITQTAASVAAPSPHLHTSPAPFVLRPCNRKLVLHSQLNGAQKRTLHPESECNKQLQDTTARSWKGRICWIKGWRGGRSERQWEMDDGRTTKPGLVFSLPLNEEQSFHYGQQC